MISAQESSSPDYSLAIASVVSLNPLCCTSRASNSFNALTGRISGASFIELLKARTSSINTRGICVAFSGSFVSIVGLADSVCGSFSPLIALAGADASLSRLESCARNWTTSFVRCEEPGLILVRYRDKMSSLVSVRSALASVWSRAVSAHVWLMTVT